MKIILLQKVNSLGSVGDEVQVTDGYARNYLIPRKFAMEATKSALKVLEQKKYKQERIEKKLQQEAEVLFNKYRFVYLIQWNYRN